MSLNEEIHKAFEHQTQEVFEGIYKNYLYKGIALEYACQNKAGVENEEIVLFIGRFLHYNGVLMESLKINKDTIRDRVSDFIDERRLNKGKYRGPDADLKSGSLKEDPHLEEFLEDERNEIDRFLDGKNASLDLHQIQGNKLYVTDKLNAYSTFLDRIEGNKERIKAMLNNSFLEDMSVDFVAFAKDKVKSDAIDLGKMETALDLLLSNADRIFFKRCLGFEIKEDKIKEYLNDKFDFNDYKRPAILEEYTDQLREYKRMLRSWLLKEFYKRKKRIGLDKLDLPEEYRIIVDYAENLLDPAEKRYLDENKTPIGDYPMHIFNSYKGYALFRLYNKHGLRTAADLNFLYYQMKEEETMEEFKIKAPPRDFRDWYDKQEDTSGSFELKRDTKSRTNPRLQSYNMVKELIDKLYKNT